MQEMGKSYLGETNSYLGGKKSYIGDNWVLLKWK